MVRFTEDRMRAVQRDCSLSDHRVFESAITRGDATRVWPVAAAAAPSGVDDAASASCSGFAALRLRGWVDSGVRAAPLEVVAPMKAVDSGGW